MRKRYENYISILLLMFFLLIPGYTTGYTIGYTTGKVVDYFTKKPIKGALITLTRKMQLSALSY
jgi:hypothetical protein